MSKPKLVIIGGFLGAGKTTSILRLINMLKDYNKKIGVITNDQGTKLVDTKFLSKKGIDVVEVTNGCFCCKFDDFLKKIDRMIEKSNPDIIIGEPVGSCTDLTATIYRPMKHFFADRVSFAPLSVLVDPKKVIQFMKDGQESLYPDEVKYLFLKQIEEADLIILNKIDKFSQQELVDAQNIIKERYPKKEIILISAKENINMDLWIDKIIKTEHRDDLNVDVNYETYGRAEASLGWLNTSLELSSPYNINVSDFIRDFMKIMKSRLGAEKIEIAHLKVYGMSENGYVKSSITGVYDDIDFTGQIALTGNSAGIIINARVNTTPDKLGVFVSDALNEVSGGRDVAFKNVKTECFAPQDPKPEYRMMKK